MSRRARGLRDTLDAYAIPEHYTELATYREQIQFANRKFRWSPIYMFGIHSAAMTSFSYTFHACSHVSKESIWRFRWPLITYVTSLETGSTRGLVSGTLVVEGTLRDNKSAKSTYSPLATACAWLAWYLVRWFATKFPLVVRPSRTGRL